MKYNTNKEVIKLQGEVLKGQLGLPNFPINPELVRKAYNKIDSFFNPISKWDSEHGTTSKASSGMLTLINPEAWVGIDEATLTAQHFGKNGQIARELEPFKGQLGSVGGQKLPPKIKLKKSPNEARRENLKKLADKSFNGDEKKALDFLISKRKK